MGIIRVDNPFGFRDYVGVGPEDIIVDLRERQASTIKSGQKLKELESIYREYRNSLKETEGISDANAILDFVIYMIDLFDCFSADYERLISEFERSVEERHIKILKQIYESSKKEQLRCRSFKNTYIVRTYDEVTDKAVRPLLDSIYVESASQLFDNLSLISLSRRLETYVGSSTNKESSAPTDRSLRKPTSRAITPLDVPEQTGWKDVFVQFISRQSVQIKVKDEFLGVKTFTELGFKDHKSRYGEPDKIWRTFYTLAAGGGTFPIGTLTQKDFLNLKSHLSTLRKRLKSVFGIAEDPFYPFYPSKTYEAIFSISSRPEVDNEEVSELRRQEDFKKDYENKDTRAAENIARKNRMDIYGLPDTEE
jgi:hypothetical protein